MTHKELVNIAMKVIKRKEPGLGAKLAFAELVTECSSRETPDAMGFTGNQTILIECKASRSDFLRDAHKLARRAPGQGMGLYRWYLCPWGVITPGELPEKWGLIWHVQKTKVEIIKQAEWQNSNANAERDFLYSVVRRMQTNKEEGNGEDHTN